MKIASTMKMVDAIVKQEPGAKSRSTGVRLRRTYSGQFKAEVVAQCMAPGASVSAIALSHGINANVIRKWLPMAPKATHVAATLLPVTIRQDSAARTLAPPAIEMSLGGATLRLPPGFDPQDLRSIVEILRTLS